MIIKVRLIFIGILCSFSLIMAQNRGNNSPIYLAGQYLGRQLVMDTQLVNTVYLKTDSIQSVSSLIPFPIDSVKNIIIVTIDSGVIKEITDRLGVTKTYTRPFSVYLDKESGKLLKIESNISSGTGDVKPDSALTNLEKRLLSKNINFIGLPDSILTSFIDIIENCPFSPHLADKISAIYILDSAITEKRIRHVWVISLIGIPPLKLSGEFAYRVPEQMRNFIRIVLDGVTGKVLTASN